jgi:Tfp pilus assembly protein PilV
MLNIICDKRGITIVEMLVAVLLTTTAVISITFLQDTSWKTVAKSDYLGRAAGILYSEMERREAIIMNPSALVTEGTMEKTVYPSGQETAIEGDIPFLVNTTIASLGTGTNAWRVTINVKWPPLNSTGITENMIVTKQDRYKF